MPEEELSEVATEAQLSGHSGRLLVKMGGGRHVALIAHNGDVFAYEAAVRIFRARVADAIGGQAQLLEARQRARGRGRKPVDGFLDPADDPDYKR